VAGDGSVVDGESGAVLVGIATALEFDGLELAAEFAEMMQVDGSLRPAQVAPTRAAAELMVVPTTAAESTLARLLRETFVYARDARLTDEALGELATLAAVYLSRFETYLAERDVSARDS
jgi:hypothetical protein